MEQMNGGYQHQPIGGLQHHGSFSGSPPEQQQQQQGGQGNKDTAAHQRTYQAISMYTMSQAQGSLRSRFR
ncbi:hypothetical protein KC341_g19075 [Hortaea werneckii]|nr:hypothetical protein KC341_g19075 [Hortaea werneckii]